MTRLVGSRDRSEFILDPAQAWQAGRKLDGMLLAATAAVPKGVTRAPHRVFNEIDDRRHVEQARRLNTVQPRA